jgi:hypothetical protein
MATQDPFKWGSWGSKLFQSDSDMHQVKQVSMISGLELWHPVVHSRHVGKPKRLVILVALAMQLGADIKMNHVPAYRAMCDSATLSNTKKRHFNTALDHYRVGRHHLQLNSPSLDELAMMFMYNETTKNEASNG